MYAIFAVLQLVFFLTLVWLIRRGYSGWAAAAVVTISPVFLSAMVIIEGRSLFEVANLGTLPWSLAIGDTIIIPTAAAVAAHGYRGVEPVNPWPIQRLEKRFKSWEKQVKFKFNFNLNWATWIVLWWCIGIGIGLLFYFVIDGPNYEAVGRAAALLSPTKVGHDFVILTALWGGMFCACLPLLWHRSWHRYVLVACFAAWVLLVVIDGQRGLDLTLLHPLWDAVRFQQKT